MRQELSKQLLEGTEQLRGLVRFLPTEQIVRACGFSILIPSLWEELRKTLSAPMRQLYFLLGLMLTTPEPTIPKELENDNWQKATKLLENITHCYALMFWPSPDDKNVNDASWTRVRKVSMPVFLHYFTTTMTASVEQIRQRIRLYLAPFDDSLKELMGISATNALLVLKCIEEILQGSADKFVDSLKRVQRANLQQFQQSFSELSEDLFKIDKFLLSELLGEDLSESFWNAFVSRRGAIGAFTYLTEYNPAEAQPLFEISDGIALCPSMNALYLAVLKMGELKLSSSSQRITFYKKRDKMFEKEVEDTLRGYLGKGEFYAGVFETSDLQHEHDVIIKWEKKLFVVESKASPPIEPFRDPDKAFLRLKRAFADETSIQKAYDQANRIDQLLRAGKAIDLFNENRVKVTTISPENIESVYLICVTRDDFGPLAVDLSLLLQKGSSEQFPWAVNVSDLQNLIEAWEYFGWGPEKLCQFLDIRKMLHGKVFDSDELQIAGFFIRHGSLDALQRMQADIVFLEPSYSSIFDHIYLAKRGGEPVVCNPQPPLMDDFRKLIQSDD